MARFARRLGWTLAVLIGGLVAATLLTARWGDRSLYPVPPGTPAVAIFLVSHGWHSGIALPREVMADVAGRRGNRALTAVATRFAAYPFIEVGWGDEAFYRNVPTAASLTIGLAAQALLRPHNPTVLHVVGLRDHPTIFPRADIVRLDLSESGYERLLARLEATFAADAGGGALEDLGPGLYGPSRFFRAVGSFHLLRVCNHWVADLLDAAGIPTAPVLATLPAGLFLDLRWRSGIVPLVRS